jgi:hypothetical protein
VVAVFSFHHLDAQGGMSTFMQSSFIKTQLTAPDAKLVAVPDAGFWWDTLQYGSTTAVKKCHFCAIYI